MQLTLDIPDDMAARLRAAHGGDLARWAVERIALAGNLDGSLSRFQVQRLLGFDNRWDTEDWLGSRGAPMRFTTDDLDADRAALARVLGR